MPGFRLEDNGAQVTLDLHGLGVQEALGVARRTLALARERRKATVRIIHGSSTSTGDPARPSIREALHRLLGEPAYRDFASGAFLREGDMLLLVTAAGARKSPPIRPFEVAGTGARPERY